MSDLSDAEGDHPMPDISDPPAAPNPMTGLAPPASQFPSSQFPSRHILTEAELDAKYPHRPKNPNPTLPFHMIYTELFEPLLSNKKKVGVGGKGFKNLKPHEVRRRIIERFIDLWRAKVGGDIYPAFRLSEFTVHREGGGGGEGWP